MVRTYELPEESRAAGSCSEVSLVDKVASGFTFTP
jgi:hypothetical protein